MRTGPRAALAAVGLWTGCDLAVSTQSRPIVGGTIDTGDPAVVAIVPRRSRCEEGPPPVTCTGTVIGPRAVLTAAHCLFPGDGPGTLEIHVGNRVGDGTGAYVPIAEVIRHPQFDRTTHAYDLAVLRLAADAPVVPVALPTAQLEAAALPATVRVVGFGVTAVGSTADGQRRQTTMTVSAIGQATFDAAPAPGNSCGGDSGGPVFVTIGGAEQLVGVTSAGDSRCEVRATNARVDIAVDAFLRPALAAPAPEEGPIGLGQICAATCATAADCPAAMACTPDSDGAMRCQVAPEAPARYGIACSTDAHCGDGGSCARITGDECRCATACTAVDGGGCAAGGGSAWGAAIALIAASTRARRRAGERTRARPFVPPAR